MSNLSFRRLALAALAGIAATVLATTAHAQGRGYINDRIAYLTNTWPVSVGIFEACAAGARAAYQRTGREEDGVAAAIACAGLTCGVTGRYYQECLEVNAEMFLLRYSREALTGY